MAVFIQKSYWRSFWFWWVATWLGEAALVFLVATLLDAEYPLMWAIFFPIAVYIAWNVMLFYEFLKRLLIFNLFLKKKRIREATKEFKQLRLPPPDPYYNVTCH